MTTRRSWCAVPAIDYLDLGALLLHGLVPLVRLPKSAMLGHLPSATLQRVQWHLPKFDFCADIRLVFRRPRGRCWDVATTYRSVVEALLDGPTVEHGELLGDNALGCGRDARRGQRRGRILQGKSRLKTRLAVERLLM